MRGSNNRRGKSRGVASKIRIEYKLGLNRKSKESCYASSALRSEGWEEGPTSPRDL